MSKRKKRKQKKIQKHIENVSVKKEQTSLVVVDKKKLSLAVIKENEIFKNVVKKMSLALISTISIAYILGIIFIATSVFYISHLQNGLIQRGVLINGISVSNLTR